MALYPVNEIRVHVIVLVLLGQTCLFFLPAFANPFQLLYVYIVTPPVVFKFVGDMDCYQSRKRQLQYTLFRGVYGTICSVGLLVITQNLPMKCCNYKLPSILFFHLVCIVSLCIIFIKIILKNFRNQEKIKIIERNWWCKSSSYCSGIGAVNC